MRFFATSRKTAAATAENLRATMDEEIAVGMRLYRAGVIVEAYADTAMERTYMLVEAPSLTDVTEMFAQYPHVRAGLIAFDFVPLIGLPAIARVHAEQGTPLPAWWPHDPPAPPAK